MDNNSKASAFGFAAQFNGESGFSHGLTKREYFAAMAMQGIISNTNIINKGNLDMDVEDKSISDASVRLANALLKALENNNSTETK